MTATDDQTRTLTEGAAIAAPQGQPEPLELERGATVGRFVVLERVGAGATATVYAAWDPQLSRRVALKVLRANSDVTERLRTLREARALAQLSHPNVVRVFDLGDVDGLPFIAMELVEGSSLRELLKTPLPEARRLALFEQAGRGLAAVHGLGIVHRDFKPANVLVGTDGRVCVSDFGLAIAASDVARPPPTAPPAAPVAGGAALEQGLTQHGLTLGTLQFTAPEQLRGEALDARADQFSFAVALWGALFDELPYGPGGVGASRPAPPPVPKRRSLTGRLIEPVLRRALDFERERRYPDLTSLLEALANARRRPTRLAAFVGVSLALAAAGVAAHRATGDDPCGARALAAAAVPEGVRASLRAKGNLNPLADVGAQLDAWLSRWVNAAEIVCRDDALRQRPTARACLERRLGDVTALTTVLTARGDPIETALPAVLALPSPDSCLTTPTSRRQVEAGARERALDRRLAEARAAELAGHRKDAVAIAREVADAAHAADDAGREAEALHLLGLGAMGTGDLVEAERALRAAIPGAMVARDERLEASVWIDLVDLIGDRARRYDEASRLLPIVRAAAARVGDDVEVHVRALTVEALVTAGLGAPEAALPIIGEAIRLAEAQVPRGPLVAFRTHNILSSVLAALGDVDGALRELELAERALAGALPEGHPSFGAVANNRGMYLLRRGDVAEARGALEQALPILEKSAHRIGVGTTLDNLATLARQQGRLDEARTLSERAIRVLAETLGTAHERTLNAEGGLALVDQAQGRLDAAEARLDRVLSALSERSDCKPAAASAQLALATLA
ncbi:MAG: serine/threonine protein kinase, partial [Myxococcaceae bacterium]|nr:serine/threonine protein kinase [Myxococcaceae bacterium]